MYDGYRLTFYGHWTTQLLCSRFSNDLHWHVIDRISAYVARYFVSYSCYVNSLFSRKVDSYLCSKNALLVQCNTYQCILTPSQKKN